MLPPVLRKAQRGISNSPRLSSLTGLCLPTFGVALTIRFRFVGQKREEVCIFTIFPSQVLSASRFLSILVPWTLTSVYAHGWIFRDGAIFPIVPALAIFMAVTVLNVSFFFWNLASILRSHIGLMSPGSCRLGSSASSASFHVSTRRCSCLRKRPPAVSPTIHLHVYQILHGDHSGGLCQVSAEVFQDTRMLIFRRHNAYCHALDYPLLFFVFYTYLW